MQAVFLGTGTSHGIPVIGCKCRVCLSPDPRNRRNRTGMWLRNDQASLIIDVSGDYRAGALRHGIDKLDGVLLTHAHSDHISGLDDLRIYTQLTGQAVPLYGDQGTLNDIQRRFDYAFTPAKEYGGGVPQYDLHEVSGPFSFGGFSITPLPVLHGPNPILGFRVGNFAFITDVTEIPDSTLALMQGLDVLALDCLRETPHSTHLNFKQAVAYARRIKARKTFFIHMCHDLEHVETEARLPPEIRLAYDGLEMEIN